MDLSINRTGEPDVIRRLRAADPHNGGAVTFDQLRTAISGFVNLEDVEVTAAKCGWDADRTADELASLGTWITLQQGPTHAHVVVDDGETGQRPLFTADGLPQVVIPDGYRHRVAGKKDISRALAALWVNRPADLDLVRYLANRFPERMIVCSFPQVAFVHRLAQIDRLDALADINPDNPAVGWLFVAAWDVLDVALADAHWGVRTLINIPAAEEDATATIRRAVASSRWLGEARMAKIDRAVQVAETSTTSTGMKMLDRELRFFAREVRSAARRWLPETIGHLTDGQVRRIAANAGMNLENSSRELESGIRSKLRKIGLAADADRLTPDGVRAHAAGLDSQWWDAMEARAGGNPDWAAPIRGVVTIG